MAKKICVVGAGLAGGIIASKLAAAGHHVVLVEQGTEPAPLMPDDETWEGGGLKSAFTRGEGIGGSSNFWHGGLIVLDESDFSGASPAGTPKYPVEYAQMREYYAQALRVMSNGEITLDDLHPRGVEEAPFRIDGERFELKPLIFPSSPFSTKGLIEDARQRHGLEVVTLTVDSLLFSDPDRVTGVEGVHPGENRRVQVMADVVVLCAGGIGSPKILLKAAESNPALKRLPIGKHLIDHPTGFVFKAKLKRRLNLTTMLGAAYGNSGHYRRRWGIKLKANHLGEAGERNHALYLRPAFTMRNPRDYNALKNKLVWHRGKKVTLWEKLQLFRYVDLLIEALNFRWGLFPSVRHVAGFVFAEQFPGSEHEIKLERDGRFTVHWNVSREDDDSLKKFLISFLESHRDLVDAYVLFPGLLDSGAHHSGGCRMAATEADGVVDDNLRVFGTGNLFVADGSVLAFNGHANTGLTIGAFALMCSDAVAQHLRAGELPSGLDLTRARPTLAPGQ
jgi:choline dehydrogenase-like flavoprotein